MRDKISADYNPMLPNINDQNTLFVLSFVKFVHCEDMYKTHQASKGYFYS
ncbi:hypothetical protein ALT1000_320031 [Alteromonas macleodii]